MDRRRSIHGAGHRAAMALSALVLGGFSAVSLAPAVIAGELEDGKSLLEQKDFSGAAKKFAEGFDKGDGEAGFHLARMVELGVGFTADPVKARALYIVSAETGSSAAMNRLGLMYLRGENVRQDFAAGAELICKSADLGNQEAQFNCAGLALEGTGREKDPQAAFNYYSKAQVSGHVGALNMLAVLTRAGTGTSADAGKALKLFEQGASLGNPVSLFNLGQMLERGEGTAPDLVRAHLYYNLANERAHPAAREALERLTGQMSPGQIEDAQARARNWKPVTRVEGQ